MRRPPLPLPRSHCPRTIRSRRPPPPQPTPLPPPPFLPHAGAGAPTVLSYSGVEGVSALAWRPRAANVLAAACSRGVCLWTHESAATSAPTQGVRRLGQPTSWRLRLLRAPGPSAPGPASSLAWSPCGLFLAAAGPASRTVTVYHVPSAAATPLRAGLGAPTLLRWSPRGGYLFAALSSGGFAVWETHAWSVETWASAAPVSDARWSPDDRALAVALRGQTSELLCLTFARGAPSLVAHATPVPLPPALEASARGAPLWDAAAGVRPEVEALAWDPAGGAIAATLRTGGDPAEPRVVAARALPPPSRRSSPCCALARLLGLRRAARIPALSLRRRQPPHFSSVLSPRRRCTLSAWRPC